MYTCTLCTCIYNVHMLVNIIGRHIMLTYHTNTSNNMSIKFGIYRYTTLYTRIMNYAHSLEGEYCWVGVTIFFRTQF